MTPSFAATVGPDGRLDLDVRERGRMRHWCRSLAGKPVEVTIAPKRKTRSGNQNRYLWGVVYPLIAASCGYLPNEVEAIHEALAMMFLAKPESSPKLPIRQSTADLSTADFEAYLEHVRIWAATELGVSIPLPNEIAA